jgi:hypothetical protein
MYTCLRALVFGEDLVSDTVGSLLSFALRRVSHGSINVDVQLLSQVGKGRVAAIRKTPLLCSQCSAMPGDVDVCSC